MNRRLPLVCFLLFLLGSTLSAAQEIETKRKPLSPKNWSKLREGDVVFIRSRTVNAPLIAALSGVAEDDADNVFTHCGIIFKGGSELKVYEGEGRGGGNWLPLAEWQDQESKRRVNGVETSEPVHNVYAMRWNGQPELETGLAKLLARAKELHDKSYDNGFSWTDEYSYCSELVWKAYEAGKLSLGTLPTMEKYVKAASPDVAKQIIKKLDDAKGKYRKKGYVAGESAISPEDIYRSSFLTPVTDESP